MNRPLVLATALIAVRSLTGSANAQDLPSPPERPVDYDQERENYSEFWERALSPAAGTYEDLVAQASAVINSSSGLRKRADEARTLLGDAIASRPGGPLAYFWLGQLEHKRGNPKRCATALSAARKSHPSFRAPANGSSLPSGWQLDYDLGLCLALSGELDEALERFEAIMTRHPSCRTKRRDRDCFHYQVPWRAGEILMALGRLEESIAMLRGAEANAPHLQYTLAIALERDEQIAESRTLLASTISADRKLDALSDSKRHFIPASDQLYYRGVVRASRREFAHARLFFNAYLSEAPNSPWRARARAHLDGARAEDIESTIVEIGHFEMPPVIAVLKSSAPRFSTCVAGFPKQLFEVRVNAKLETAGRGTKVVRSVTVAHFDPMETKRLSTEIIPVTRCLRKVGAELKLPKPKGQAGTRAYVRFYVGGS